MAISEGTILRIVGSMLFPDSVIAQNVFNAVLTTAGGSSAEVDVVADMADWLEDMYFHLLAYISDTATSTDVKVYEYDDIDDDWDEVGSDTWTAAFGNAEQMLPNGVAVIVHARTTDPDVQGTKYLGGMGEDRVHENDIAGALATVALDFLDEWITPFVGSASGATFTPVIWSPTGTVAVAMSGTGYVNAQVGYQRRRKPGVGI